VKEASEVYVLCSAFLWLEVQYFGIICRSLKSALASSFFASFPFMEIMVRTYHLGMSRRGKGTYEALQQKRNKCYSMQITVSHPK